MDDICGRYMFFQLHLCIYQQDSFGELLADDIVSSVPVALHGIQSLHALPSFPVAFRLSLCMVVKINLSWDLCTLCVF